MYQPKLKNLVSCLSLMLLATGQVHAVDGVLEINAAKVDGTGGFPYAITQSGTYRLTSNLTVSATDKNGIAINVNDVTLDLNGFTITGPSSGTGVGIRSETGGNIRVLNGSVASFGGLGIWISFGAVVDNVRVISNGGKGILIEGAGSRVTDCLVAGNGGGGIELPTNGTVTGNTVTFNTGHGIQTLGGGLVSGNIVSNNTVDGIIAQKSTVRGNTVLSNSSSGIDCFECTVVGNTSSENTRWGLDLSAFAGYANNVVNGNGSGAINNGVAMGGNACNGVACP